MIILGSQRVPVVIEIMNNKYQEGLYKLSLPMIEILPKAEYKPWANFARKPESKQI